MGDSKLQLQLQRREWLKRAAGTAAGVVAGQSLIGRAFAADPLVIGAIYVGPRGDFGWNQSHATGVEILKKLPGVKVIEEERVAETIAVSNTMESMIRQEGAKLILGTSFGYFDPHMINMAKKYPNVVFRHPTTLWSKDKHPMNLGGYFCFLDQAHYVDGAAAGLSTKTNKIGYVAAKPISVVLRNINAFTVAARKVNPKVVVQVVFTGEWSLPVREAEMTNSLVDAGCDVIACHVDSPKVVLETAEKRGVKSCGHNVSQAGIAPKGFITGAENKYETIYKSFADSIMKGATPPNVLVGGYDKDFVRNTTYGAGATDAGRKAAAAAIADMKAGKPMFAGPIKDNKGKVVLEKATGNYDPILDQMNYLVEGVSGSIG
jgi:simple sugar transport system substrate-binding protein